MPNSMAFNIPPGLTIIVPAKPVTKLAFCGGGAKGAAYPGAIIALKEKGLMNNIDTVAGSSAGSFMALLVALGCTTDEIIKITDEMNFLKFLDASTKNNLRDRGICDGKLLYQYIQKITDDKIKYHITVLQSLFENVKSSDDPDKLFLLEQLAIMNKKNTFTFDDLAQLKDMYKIFYKENILKDLLVTGTNITDIKLEVFSARSTPGMEIAKAIHISAAFPVVFKSVLHNGKRYIDGGAMDNLPIRVLHEYSNDKSFKFLNETTLRQEALGFMLGKPETDQALHLRREAYQVGFIPTIINYFIRRICKIHFNNTNAELLQSLHHDYALRTVALPTSNVDTLTAFISKKTRQQLIYSSEVAVNNYLTQRTNEAVYYREKDLMSSLLQIMRNDEEAPAVYDGIVNPVLAANLAATEEDKEAIKTHVMTLANNVRNINLTKDLFAQELLAKIKDTNAKLIEYFEFYNQDSDLIREGAYSTELKAIKTSQVEAGIKNCVTALNKYTDVTAITELNKGETSPRHLEILLERLQPHQSMFNQLINNVNHYVEINQQHKVSRKSHKNINATLLLRQLDYFELQRKKTELISVLVHSKGKYFQREYNVKLLSKAIADLREAKDMQGFNKALHRVKTDYKPRTFFSLGKPLVEPMIKIRH